MTLLDSISNKLIMWDILTSPHKRLVMYELSNQNQNDLNEGF